jgi:hypothetical protein
VNFAVVDGLIVLRTTADSAVARRVDSVIVAFEEDVLGPAACSGWSVTVTGRAALVTGPGTIARYRAVPLVPWVPGTLSRQRLHSIAVWHPRRRDAGSRKRSCSGTGQSARWKGTLVTTTRGRDCRTGCSLSATCSCKMRCHQCRSTSSGTATVSVRSGRCSCRSRGSWPAGRPRRGAARRDDDLERQVVSPCPPAAKEPVSFLGDGADVQRERGLAECGSVR